jgi:hypothetical protein
MHWFCKPSPAHRTHHLHLVPTGSRRYRDELAFRDILRSRSDLAARYQELKRSLALEHRNDREAYTAQKQPFIADALLIAAREAEVTGLLRTVADWARSRPGITGLSLLGSWARNAAQADSDLDFILLADDPHRRHAEAWLSLLGDPPVVGSRRWGNVAETRARLRSGLEVELGVAPSSWAATKPVDGGAARVVRGGFRILFDPIGTLADLEAAVGDC